MRSVAARLGVSRKAVSNVRDRARKLSEEADLPAIELAEAGPDLDVLEELKRGLLADFRAAKDPKDRASLAGQISKTIEAIARASAPERGDATNIDAGDAETFDAYMLRLVERVRRIGAGGLELPAAPT